MMTVYKVHGFAYDYLAAVDEEQKMIYVFTDDMIERGYHKPVDEITREDVTDASAGIPFTASGKDDWKSLLDDVVFENGNATIMETWEGMDI